MFRHYIRYYGEYNYMIPKVNSLIVNKVVQIAQSLIVYQSLDRYHSNTVN